MAITDTRGESIVFDFPKKMQSLFVGTLKRKKTDVVK